MVTDKIRTLSDIVWVKNSEGWVLIKLSESKPVELKARQKCSPRLAIKPGDQLNLEQTVGLADILFKDF